MSQKEIKESYIAYHNVSQSKRCAMVLALAYE